MSNVAVVGAENFGAEVEQSSGPVVVDFSAEWCPPCRALGPVLDRAAAAYAGQVKFVKLDVDANQDVATRYGAMRLPTLLFFKNGQVVDQSIGFINDAQLTAKVSALL